MTAATQGKTIRPGIEVELPPEVYRQAVDQADIAISITDPKANILFANEAFTRITGYAADEIMGCNESVLSNHTTPPALYRDMWAHLGERRAWTGRVLNKRKNGELYLADLAISPVVSAAGKVTHFLGIHRDVTELHRLERVVRNQKKLIESAVDAAPVALVLLDQNGRVMLDNQAYKKLVSDLGVSEPAEHLLDATRPDWRAALATIAPGTALFINSETRVDRHGGGARWLSITASVIEMQSDCADTYFCVNTMSGLLLVIADVTHVHEERERARAAALKVTLIDEERTAAIREGLSAAVFRMDEPLNMMRSAVAVLRRRDPAAASVLDDALNASREHLDQLRQVIPPVLPEMMVSVNLNEILRDVLEVCTPRLLAAGITVDWRPATTLPTIAGRPLQLRTMFKALVDNAIEAMNVKGWLRRELSITSGTADERIVVCVFDTGPGVSDEVRQRAFEPFFSAKSGGGHHLGTGLSRALQVVSDHGGIIDLNPRPQGGCAAIVELRIDGDPI